MKELSRKIFFTLFCFYSLYFFVGSTLSPIMAHYGHYELSAKLTSLYMYSCHQQPDRSFWLLGYPIPLCCRCYGVYLSAAVSSVMAVYNRLNIRFWVFAVIFVLAMTDIYINYGMGTLNNTGNVTRFIAGILLGVVIVKGLDFLLRIIMKGRKNED